MARQHGLIVYSDEVSIDSAKCRLMILERAVVCVRIRMSVVSEKPIDCHRKTSN